MIYTLTTNPAVDMNVTTDAMIPEKVNRTRDAVYTQRQGAERLVHARALRRPLDHPRFLRGVLR